MPAKALAYGMGADFLEQDVVATRDQALVVLHDTYLDDVSNVASAFPGRQRGDGRFYAIDFDKAELRRLTLRERRRPGAAVPMFPGRFSPELADLRVVTLADEIRLVGGLNATTNRRVGIYPEIKDPGWHLEAGIDLTRLVHETLENERECITGPVFVQSFDETALRRMVSEFGSSWPLIRLLDADTARGLARNPEQIEAIAEYAAGVGVPYRTLIDVSDDGSLHASSLAGRLAASDLLVHPYTLRRDADPVDGVDYDAALAFLILDLEVDAIFCDQPDDAIAVRDCISA
jgi:glycerophosphoryl diester phosphodiesterase